MPSIAEVFVTVLPSEPVDTTSFYKRTSYAWPWLRSVLVACAWNTAAMVR